ncbi:hypothetical protein SAVIM338S_03929 [Streptomyces avidinii]
MFSLDYLLVKHVKIYLGQNRHSATVWLWFLL